MIVADSVACMVFGGDHENKEGQFGDPDIDG